MTQSCVIIEHFRNLRRTHHTKVSIVAELTNMEARFRRHERHQTASHQLSRSQSAGWLVSQQVYVFHFYSES
jgi:hypothetical protein